MFVNRQRSIDLMSSYKEWFNLANTAGMRNDQLVNTVSPYADAYYTAYSRELQRQRTVVDRYSREGWITECIDALPDILYALRPYDSATSDQWLPFFPEPRECECEFCQDSYRLMTAPRFTEAVSYDPTNFNPNDYPYDMYGTEEWSEPADDLLSEFPELRYLCGPIPRPLISKPHDALTLLIADILSPPLRNRI